MSDKFIVTQSGTIRRIDTIVKFIPAISIIKRTELILGEDLTDPASFILETAFVAKLDFTMVGDGEEDFVGTNEVGIRDSQPFIESRAFKGGVKKGKSIGLSPETKASVTNNIRSIMKYAGALKLLEQTATDNNTAIDPLSPNPLMVEPVDSPVPQDTPASIESRIVARVNELKSLLTSAKVIGESANSHMQKMSFNDVVAQLSGNPLLEPLVPLIAQNLGNVPFISVLTFASASED